MLIAHYAHRLPSTYDVNLIRTRAAQRGPDWDAIPELYFKGFLLRERGRYGIAANEYSSFYLWRHEDGLSNFLRDDRPGPGFKGVTDSFGRPDIQTALALDARMGRGRVARFAYKEERDISRDANLSQVCAQEAERNRAVASEAATVAAAVAIDPREWRVILFVLSENEPTGDEQGAPYEVLYLARPLLETLPA
jgi:hypothetical protein